MSEGGRIGIDAVTLSMYEAFGRDVLEPVILPLYRLPYPGNPREIVPRTVHGVLHICRCEILGEAMMNFYDTLLGQANFDRFAVRHAIAFHDVARQDDGVDRWEHDSAATATRFLAENHLNRPPDYAEYVGRLIDKAYVSRHLPDDVNAFIATAADCLDILRVFPLNRGFRRDMLAFLDADHDVVLALARRTDVTPDPDRLNVPSGQSVPAGRGVPPHIPAQHDRHGNPSSDRWMFALREGLLQDVARWIDDTENWRLQKELEATATPLLVLLDGLHSRTERYPVLAKFLAAEVR